MIKSAVELSVFAAEAVLAAHEALRVIKLWLARKLSISAVLVISPSPCSKVAFSEGLAAVWNFVLVMLVIRWTSFQTSIPH